MYAYGRTPCGRPTTSTLDFAIEQGIVPTYFSTIKARLLAMQELPTNQPSTIRFLGGGTDLYVQRPEEMEEMAAQSLFDRSHLQGIRENNGYIEIGGATTATDLMESPIMQEIFPNLKKHLKLVSSTPIRNMATVAGNLVNASPIGDLTVWMLALNTTVILRNGQTREVLLRDFYRGYKLLDKTSAFLVGKLLPVNEIIVEKILAEANEIMQSEISPISDVRGSEEYKRLLLRQLFHAHWLEICKNC